jgi:hypothetical protein
MEQKVLAPRCSATKAIALGRRSPAAARPGETRLVRVCGKSRSLDFANRLAVLFSSHPGADLSLPLDLGVGRIPDRFGGWPWHRKEAFALRCCGRLPGDRPGSAAARNRG